ncbi:brassinosteroid-responsive RING protein 1-like [Rhodamnia argentea]|uniref:Brassinosteroid-responsive RING protein 1-like n=1 Tax=Rhodamnia argentea TaxID=178133 RepID=A0A8B8PTN5_9MYRT|nr:brassinosteroid-responsive RING protein 1-like [Rhodamnia argentea]
MGFPVCYTDLLLPNLFLRTFSLFAPLRTAVHFLLRLPGLLEPDPTPLQEPESLYSSSVSPSLTLMRELLPVVRFSDLADGCPDPPESACSVCLHDFEADDEIRRLLNCRHVFHWGCLDRWIGYARRTCPLCRAPVVPDEVEGPINERLWAASGVPELHEDSYGDARHGL